VQALLELGLALDLQAEEIMLEKMLILNTLRTKRYMKHF
jgi:hypothetical protein